MEKTQAQNTNASTVGQDLLSDEFISSIDQVAQIIIKTNDAKKAASLSGKLKTAVAKMRRELDNNKELENFYFDLILKLQFIGLPLLKEGEIESLIKNYFTWHFRILYYDIWEKLKQKLIMIGIHEDRDKLKEQIKKALLENEEVIISSSKIKTIKAWLNDYNSKLGIGRVKNITKAQYMINIRKEHNMKEGEEKRLKTLFAFYERLKLSSLTPEGYEEEVPIVIGNKLQIFRQGILEPVGGSASKLGKISGPPKTESEKNIEKLRAEEEALPENSLERMALDEEVDKQKHLEELQYQATQFPDGSLERMALEEEISRLKK